MKKILLLLVLMLLPMVASADESGTCGENLTWTFVESTGTLTISGSGEMTNYSYLEVPWHNFRNNITKVIINSGVTTIGERAFSGCSGLTSITIPDGVTTIGGSAFYGCSGLISITIPDGVTSIGNDAFYQCSGLTSITIPDGVTSIGIDAFYQCSGLTSITIPDGVTKINYRTFWGCSGLTSIKIPDGVTSIDEQAFEGCSGLTSITIPNSVTSISYRAFWGCRGLTSIKIPDGVTSISDYAFQTCSGLTSITIPDGITIINEGTFKDCSELTTVVLPNKLSMIKKDAFYGCSKLKTILIPETVGYIYQQAFYNCSGLESVKVQAVNPPFAYDNTFSNYDIPLYVPEGSVSLYQSNSPWSKFTSFKTLSGEDITITQCAKPTISYKNGKLSFASETEGVTFNYNINIKDNDIKSGTANEVQLSVTYTITVHASKTGCKNSENATATLCWIDADPKTEGITDGIANVPAQAVMIQNNGGTLTIQGANDGTPVSVYNVNGVQQGSATITNGSASVNTNMQPGSIAIVKIGQKSVKVVIK